MRELDRSRADEGVVRSRQLARRLEWERLAVNQKDFDEFKLIKLKPKKLDKRYQAFVTKHGNACAEVDAIPPQELRRRVEESITQHIPQAEWERLQKVEELEKESFSKLIEKCA